MGIRFFALQSTAPLIAAKMRIATSASPPRNDVVKQKIPTPEGVGIETLFKLLDYSRVEKCLMVRHI